jgi:hypothetical protein
MGLSYALKLDIQYSVVKLGDATFNALSV